MREFSPDCRYKRFNTLIGSGTFKNVYRAYDTQKGRDVAWSKVKLSSRQKDDNQIHNEMQLLSMLGHPNILELHYWWTDEENEEINLITQFFYSGSLKDFVKSRGIPCMDVLRVWGKQIVRALHYLHDVADEKPILHRDLKLSNVLIHGHTSRLKLADFGLATVKASGRRLVGTMTHVSPEMLDGNYDEKVDIYAFGMLMCELATGTEAYVECKTISQLMKKINLKEKPKSLQTVRDTGLKAMIETCLAPADRRPSAADLLVSPFFSDVIESWEDLLED
jgi:WNK lysine deficient protein kinase